MITSEGTKRKLQSTRITDPSMRSIVTNVLGPSRPVGKHSLARGLLLMRSTPADWHVLNDRPVHMRETCAPLVIMLGEIVRGYRGSNWRALDKWWKRFIHAAEQVHKDLGMPESQRVIVRKTSLLAYKCSWQQRFPDTQQIKHLTNWSHWLESCAYSKSLSIATLEIVYDLAQTLGPVDKRSARALERLTSLMEGTTTRPRRKARPSLLKAKWRNAPLWFSGLLLAGMIWAQLSVYSHYSDQIERSLMHHVNAVTQAVSSRPGL